MSGTLQTGTAVVTVVQLSIAAAKFIRRIARAQDEANRWFSDLDRMTKLWTLVNNSMLRRRQETNGSCTSSHEEDTINVIKSSMKACKRYITTMEAKLEALAQHPVYFQISQVPARVKFLYDKSFIEDQEKELAKHITSLQVCLDLLHQIDLNTLITGQRSQEKRLSFLQHILSADIVPPDHLELSRASTHPDSEGPSDWSGETVWSNVSSPEHREIQLDSDEEVLVAPSRCSINSVESNESQSTDNTLIRLVRENDLEPIRRMLGTSEDRNTLSTASRHIQRADSDGWTVLHHAAYECNPDITQVLLEYCKSNAISIVNAASSEDKHTALMEAAKKADTPAAAGIAKDLLAYGAEVDKVDDEHRCALHFAMCRPRDASGAGEQFVDVLLDHKPKPNLELVVETLGKQYIKKKYPKVWNIYEVDGLQRIESLDSGIGMETPKFRRRSHRFSRNSRNSDN